MLRTVIIDDEYHIRDTLTSLLESYCPQVSKPQLADRGIGNDKIGS